MFKTLNETALIVAAVIFLLSILIVWALKRFSIAEGSDRLALLALPVVGYIAVAGDFTVEKGEVFGIEFAAASAAPIAPAQLMEDMVPIDSIPKGGLDQIAEEIAKLKPGTPIAITLELGRSGYYQPGAIIAYLRAFQTFDPDLSVVFIDTDTGDFIASSNGVSVLAALTVSEDDYLVEENRRRFIDAVEYHDLNELARLIVLTTGAVTPETPNLEALRLMQAEGVGSLIVTQDGRPTGVIRRDAILSRLMLTLAES